MRGHYNPNEELAALSLTEASCGQFSKKPRDGRDCMTTLGLVFHYLSVVLSKSFPGALSKHHCN